MMPRARDCRSQWLWAWTVCALLAGCDLAGAGLPAYPKADLVTHSRPTVPAVTAQPGARPGELAAKSPANSSAAVPADDAASKQASQNLGTQDKAAVGGANQASTLLPGAVSAEPRKMQLLVKERTFQIEGPDDAVRVGYDDLDLLKVLNVDKTTPGIDRHFPAWLKGLSGQRVRIRGFMVPPGQESDLPFFVLARDTGVCCFGPNPTPYYLIAVTMREGTTADYIPNRPFDVAGRFKIELSILEDGTVAGLYFIEDAQVVDR